MLVLQIVRILNGNLILIHGSACIAAHGIGNNRLRRLTDTAYAKGQHHSGQFFFLIHIITPTLLSPGDAVSYKAHYSARFPILSLHFSFPVLQLQYPGGALCLILR